VLLHLHQTSLLLRTVLFVVDEARVTLDTFTQVPGKPELERAATAALKLLHTNLRLSESFISAGRSAGASTVLTSLAKLLLGVNPRTGKPDHVLNMTRFVFYGHWLPEAKLAAVSIIKFGGAAGHADRHPRHCQRGAADLQRGAGRGGGARGGGAGQCAGGGGRGHDQTMPAPSLSHFLLGFNLKKGVSATQLESPHIAGIRTPLHAILSLLSRQHSQLATLLGLLLDRCEADTEAAATSLYQDTTFSQLSRTVTATTTRQLTDSPASSHRLALVLGCIEFESGSMVSPGWDLFDESQVAGVLEQCQVANMDGGSGEPLVDVASLHRILAVELATIQGSAAVNQRATVQSEIRVQENAAARRDLLDSWRQVAETLLTLAPAELLPAASKQQILLQLLQTLLNKVAGESLVSGMDSLVSSTVLLLMTALRQTYTAAADKQDNMFAGDGAALEIITCPVLNLRNDLWQTRIMIIDIVIFIYCNHYSILIEIKLRVSRQNFYRPQKTM